VMIIALGLLLGLGLLIMVARAPALGLVGLVVASLLVPLELDTGTGTGIGINLVLVVGLAGIWIIRAATRQDESLLPTSRAVLPLLALCLVAILALGIGQLPWFAFVRGAPMRAQVGGLATILMSVATFLLAATQIRRLAWLQTITWIFVALGGTIVASQLVGGPFRIVNNLIALGSLGSLFWIWLTAMAAAQALFNSRLSRHWRIVLATLVLAIFYLNLFHGSPWVSGWLPPLVTLLIIMWLGMPRIAAAVLVASVVAVFTTANWASRFNLLGDNEYSLLTRLEAWRILGEIVRVSPLLGLGPANYYWYAPLFPILGYSVRFSSHNNYVDLTAQTGILGLVCFLAFAIAMTIALWRLIKMAPDGFPSAYAIGALGGLGGTLAAGMLGDWVIPFVYNVGMKGMRASLIGWLFLGGVVALDRIVKSEKLVDERHGAATARTRAIQFARH
ncbi:MAG: O-antigen ligase family protein, partial [Anaerolineales bacterium]